jgi:putative transposase
VPRARVTASDGKTAEWKSQALRAYQRRTLAADALIASTYLAGTNTRRVRRALAALVGGTVGKDTASRTWRKVKSDWDAWNTRSLAGEPIVRLILDGTVVRVRLDRKATSISLLVVLGVRADGQKVLLAIKSMGGESAEAWRTMLDDLVKRGLRWRTGARQGHCLDLGRRAGSALHGPQAPQPVCARPRAAARRDHPGLQRHDLRDDA